MSTGIAVLNTRLAESASEFFKPVETNKLELLFAQHKNSLKRIREIDEVINGGEYHSAISYYIAGNKCSDRGVFPNAVELFNAENAIKALEAESWNRAMQLTDVMEYMPQKRRSEWQEQIRDHKAPPFIEESVISTLQQLLVDRGKYLAERVDGFFRALSGEHVTNQPEGFSKRMIVNRAFDTQFGMSPNNDRAGYLSDLRMVIAKFMGRNDEPVSSYRTLEVCGRRTGEWHEIDGGALKVRVYKKGTMHIEVHPDIAWRLNEILATLYPTAIPEKNRKRKPSTKKAKTFVLDQKFLSPNVLNELAEFRSISDNVGDIGRGMYHRGYMNDKHLRKAVDDVMKAIGGVDAYKMVRGYNRWDDDRRQDYYKFDYDVRDVLDNIIISGQVPDQKSHQFYPTQEKLAAQAVQMAGIEPHHTCLEPQAGQGGLAKFMPKEQTTCVEVSELHCSILREKGFETIQGDFLKYNGEKVDRIVCNPPFSQGRAQAHLEKGLQMLKSGGRMVAILPASFAGKEILTGCTSVYSEIYDNEFAGCSASVVLLTVEKD